MKTNKQTGLRLSNIFVCVSVMDKKFSRMAIVYLRAHKEVLGSRKLTSAKSLSFRKMDTGCVSAIPGCIDDGAEYCRLMNAAIFWHNFTHDNPCAVTERHFHLIKALQKQCPLEDTRTDPFSLSSINIQSLVYIITFANRDMIDTRTGYIVRVDEWSLQVETSAFISRVRATK